MYIGEPEILNAIKSESTKQVGLNSLSPAELDTVIQNQLIDANIHKSGQIDVRFNLEHKGA